jgi:hypothetical protein
MLVDVVNLMKASNGVSFTDSATAFQFTRDGSGGNPAVSLVLDEDGGVKVEVVNMLPLPPQRARRRVGKDSRSDTTVAKKPAAIPKTSSATMRIRALGAPHGYVKQNDGKIPVSPTPAFDNKSVEMAVKDITKPALSETTRNIPDTANQAQQRKDSDVCGEQLVDKTSQPSPQRVQFMLEVGEKADARRTTRSRRGAPAPLSGNEELVLQNPTRALAALVSDAGITTAEAKKMLEL